MDSELAAVLPLALGSAISPTVLLLQLVVLGSEDRPVRRGILFVLGCELVLIELTIVAFLLTGIGSGRSNTHGGSSTALVDLFFGLVCFALAARNLWFPSNKPPRQHKPTQRLWPSFALGYIAMTTNVTTIVLYLPAMHDVARSDVDLATQVVVVFLVMSITTLPATVPLMMTIASPQHAGAALQGLDRYLKQHKRTVNVVVTMGFGVFLTARGIAGL